MLEAYKDYWVRGIDFSGKTSREGYWYAVLINFVLSIVLGMILSKNLQYVWSFINLVPGIAAALRRLRSAGKNPALLALAIIPLVNFYVLYLLIQPDKD